MSCMYAHAACEVDLMYRPSTYTYIHVHIRPVTSGIIDDNSARARALYIYRQASRLIRLQDYYSPSSSFAKKNHLVYFFYLSCAICSCMHAH